jgi:hypothetical protein
MHYRMNRESKERLQREAERGGRERKEKNKIE